MPSADKGARVDGEDREEQPLVRDSVPKPMKFAHKSMKFALKTMDFVLKMMDFARQCKAQAHRRVWLRPVRFQ